MEENSIEDRINNAYCFLNSMHSDFRTGLYYKEDLENLEHILSDYKRVLKENEIYKKNSEIMSKENLSTAEQLKVEIKENFRLKNQLENNRKEYQETYKDVREELKELKKENEELKNNKSIVEKILHKGKGFTLQQTQYIWEHYIPVQKVKDKIEEYKNMLKTCNKAKDIDRIKAINERILELQELLEGRK